MKVKEMSCLLIISGSAMEDYPVDGQVALSVYKRLRVITSEPKSKRLINRIESTVREEAGISNEIDILFWKDISKKDVLIFSERVKKISEKINCHHFISEDLVPQKI